MADKANSSIEVTALLFETRIALSAVHAGVELLAMRSTEPSIISELNVLTKLSNQACEVLERLQKAIAEEND